MRVRYVCALSMSVFVHKYTRVSSLCVGVYSLCLSVVLIRFAYPLCLSVVSPTFERISSPASSPFSWANASTSASNSFVRVETVSRAAPRA